MENYKIEMKDISIEFPGVKALSNVDFEVETGKSYALIGANGAGKSTLMKVLSGSNTHYTGQIYSNGKPIEIRSPKAAVNQRIAIVYQEVDTALIPYLSVAENVMFNITVNDMGKKQLIKWKELKSQAQKVLAKLNVDINVNKRVSELSLAQKQMVLIARCIAENCRFLILDEPTAPLSNSETQELFRVVRDLIEKQNVGVIFISHRLNELYEICSEITIMRDGKNVISLPLNEELSVNQIVEYMLGRKFDENYPKKDVAIGDKLLEVKGLTEKDDKIKDVSMYVRRGEIIGVAGLVGAGKTELCKTLFGVLKQKSGEVVLNGKKVSVKIPTHAVKQGFALVPEERRKEGIMVSDPVYSNVTVAALSKYTKSMVVNKKKEKADARKFISDLGIKTPSENQKVALLSGGNQQKVAVAKWLNTDAEIYIFDEPTKGVDVGAKRDIFELIEGLAENGKGIIYASCEFSEILAIADRTYVMYDGKIVAELTVADTDEKQLLYYSTGGI